MGGRLFGNLFISAGAMKAGTTWLYAVMERHPDLHFTPEKEIHYFYHRYVDNSVLSDKRRLEQAKRRYFDRIDPERSHIDKIRWQMHWLSNYLSRPVDDLWYRTLFSYPRGEKYGCDFSNFYAQLPVKAWRRIARDSDRLRVIYTLRHPVKRLWSHVKFHLQVTGELDKLERWGPEEVEAFARKDFMWVNAEYGAALRAMKAGLPKGTLMPVFFEDLHADQRGTLAAIEDFLGIRHFDYPEAVLGKRVNESAPHPMPDYFPDLFAGDVARITAEVEAEGLTIPGAWATA